MTDKSTPEMEQPERRTFLQNAAVAAGAVAATAGMASVAKAEACVTKDGIAAKNTLGISFDARKAPDIYELQKVIEQALDLGGCPTCGLVGLDLHLQLDRVLEIDADLGARATLNGQGF